MIRFDLVRCPFCCRIMPSEGLYGLDIPCPICSKSGEFRIDWPSGNVKRMFMQIDELDINNSNNWSITVVLTCSFLDLLLNQLLTIVLHYHKASPLISEYIRLKSKNQMFEAIKKLSGNFSINKSLKDNGFQEFVGSWKKLVSERNNFIHHGIPVSSECLKYIEDVRINVYDAFKTLNNNLLDHLDKID